MKQLIKSILIVFLFCGWHAHGLAQVQHEQHILLSEYDPTPDRNSYFSPHSDIPTQTANREIRCSLVLPVESSFQKFPFVEQSIDKNIELALCNAGSFYLCLAECHVIPFEGPDIIHPFNCFW